MENNNCLQSWVQYDSQTQFPIQNIPFGVCRILSTDIIRCCTRIGEFAIDLYYLESNKLLDSDVFRFENNHIFKHPQLNTFISLGRPVWRAVRERIQEIYRKDSKYESQGKGALIDLKNIANILPINVPDYSDFFSSRNHAYNLGSIMRGPKDALQPNWVHLPVGYHGITISDI